MCLGIPAQVMELAESVAVVEVGGVRREVSVELLDDVATGDWVIIHAGFAIQKLDPEEAEKTLRLFKEIADAIP
jgi:hydrogenase expression/formation protein HypC